LERLSDTLCENGTGQPGPATQLVTGRAVINVDTAGNWTTASQSGRVTDICARTACHLTERHHQQLRPRQPPV